ncbi:MAG: DUF697 domain-containing protein, partial [Bacteroidota bacterium]
DFASKQLKKSIMNFNNSDKDSHADTVIRNHVLWSMGASYVIPLPVADVFAVSALQLDMIRQLCRVYGLDFAETQGKAIVSSLTTSTMARAGARSLIKLIPGLGTVVGGITVAAVNGASTYALGQVFKKHFKTGGTILDFDTERLKKMYNEQFEKGKSIATKWKEEADEEERKKKSEENKAEHKPSDDVPPPPKTETASPTMPTDEALAKLKELAEMKAQNIITEEEFELMKKRIIGE